MNQAIVELPIDNLCVVSRKKRGRGYEYFDQHGNKIKQRADLQRLKGIVIPPMWSNVGISSDAHSHVQAIGFDTKGRKQYIYHPLWQEAQQQKKFALLEEFANQLPAIRRAYDKDCAKNDWSMKHLTAIATWLLDDSGIRIGNDGYTQSNNTFGLTTLRRKHVETRENNIQLEFIGKHNKARCITIDDPELAETIKRCSEQPGYRLLRYKQKGRWHDLCSDDVNEYIQSISSPRFSSKFFRTWVGTRLAVAHFPSSCDEAKANPRKTLKRTLVAKVARDLGNTPSICEQYYIHPTVLASLLKRYESETINEPWPVNTDKCRHAYDLREEERIALALISG